MNNTGPRGGCLFPLGLMALILAAALGACAPRAQAQQPVLPGKQICSNASGSTVCSFQPVTDASPLPVSATASIAGFNQETVLTPFTATTSGVTSSSFTAGKVIVVTNAGTTNMAYCRLGASATTSGQPIAPNGGWFAFTTVAETQVTCATSTSTTTINVSVGTGLPTGTGGGGGSGGGGAVTIADGADVTQGAIADAAVTAGGTGTLSAKLRYMTTQLDNINTNVQSAIPAGTNVIGFTSNDPCSRLTKSGASINLTASGQVIAGTAAKKTYICSIDLISATAQNIALVEGTGSVCATNIFGLAGGTTAGTGWNFAANGGLTKGSGNGTVYSPSADSNATAANICLLLSSTGQTSGHVTYVQE